MRFLCLNRPWVTLALMKKTLGLLFLIVVVWLPASAVQAIQYDELLHDLFDPLRLARADLESTQLHSSYDRSGGNDDFNGFHRSLDNGWVELVDLKGPGYISRFWFTGAGGLDLPVQIWIDDAERPTFETTINQFFGGMDPLRPPLASFENYCWYSWLPISYQKRLRIRMQGLGPEGKFYYQISETRLPGSTEMESWSPALLETHRSLLERIRDAGLLLPNAIEDDSAIMEQFEIRIEAGEEAELFRLETAGILTELRLNPGITADTLSLLRDTVLRIYYDGSDDASVAVPLGDFFGIPWKPMQYRSNGFGMDGDNLIFTLPIPFQKSLRMTLEQQASEAFTVKGAVRGLEKPSDTSLRYLHAAWNRSGPESVGKPFELLRCEGSGHLAGCLLTASSLDRSWWILESDEQMWIDGESSPSWRGTGLEDYFNGGWYYQNALARPLNGIVFKAPFRSIQYRLHALDPVSFGKSFRMNFEKGPFLRTHGVMESVVWYYLDTPTAAASYPGRPEDRRPPEDEFGAITLMHELNNLERLGDFENPVLWMHAYQRRYPDQKDVSPLLDLRALLYRAWNGEVDQVVQELQTRLPDLDGLAARQARDWLWLQEDPLHGLLGITSSHPARFHMDGRVLKTLHEPEQMSFFRVKMNPGRHVLGVDMMFAPYPSWIQISLMNRDGVIGTSPDWRTSLQSEAGWSGPDFDDSDWPRVGGSGVKGPPEVPYVLLRPNIYPGSQSQTVGIRPDGDAWQDQTKPAYLRSSFEWPPVPSKK